jgi:hypothetical protein
LGRIVVTVSTEVEAQLIALVLHGVTSVHSRRSYRTGLEAFFACIRVSGAGPAFTKALAQPTGDCDVAGGAAQQRDQFKNDEYIDPPLRGR